MSVERVDESAASALLIRLAADPDAVEAIRERLQSIDGGSVTYSGIRQALRGAASDLRPEPRDDTSDLTATYRNLVDPMTGRLHQPDTS